MNENTSRARNRMIKQSHTCVLCKGDLYYTADTRGIAPMMQFLEKRIDLVGFSVADRVVGRAAAMLFALAGIREVWADVISCGALEFFSKNQIAVEYGTLTERIINRSGDGFCPMETAVMGIDEPQEAYRILMQKMQEIKALGKENPLI